MNIINIIKSFDIYALTIIIVALTIIIFMLWIMFQEGQK